MTSVGNADCYLTEMHLDFWTQIGYTLELFKYGRPGRGRRLQGELHMATVGERAGLAATGGQVGTEPDGSRERGRKRSGMVVPRVFSTEGVSPFDQVDWDLRTAEIKDERGRAIFQQVDCEIPAWLEPARHQRRGQQVLLRRRRQRQRIPGEGKREYSVRQLIDRVTRTIADWGRDDGYFATAEDAERFYDELTALCLNQYGSFNSPVWFNVGLFHRYGIAGPANNWRWDEETRTVVQGHQRLPDAPGLGLLHPERQRRHGRHHAAGPQRGHALQVRLGHRARTSRRSAPAARSSPAAASRRGRSASCGSTTPSPAWSSRAARPAGPPRCRPSSAGTPTSSSSSSARPRRKPRPRP